MRSSRYMNGGGSTHRTDPFAAPRSIAATLGLGRIRSFSHVAYERVEPTALTAIHMPYRTRLSPHLNASRRHSVEWAGRMGMLERASGPHGWNIWNAPQLAGFDFALCAAAIIPVASAAELDISTEWLTWGTYADDFFPTVFGRTRDVAGARTFNERLTRRRNQQRCSGGTEFPQLRHRHVGQRGQRPDDLKAGAVRGGSSRRSCRCCSTTPSWTRPRARS
jgi:germacradienol/geosmin synthase